MIGLLLPRQANLTGTHFSALPSAAQEGERSSHTCKGRGKTGTKQAKKKNAENMEMSANQDSLDLIKLRLGSISKVERNAFLLADSCAGCCKSEEVPATWSLISTRKAETNRKIYSPTYFQLS